MTFISKNRRHDKQHFYKYVTAETAKAVLSSRSLRWSAPMCFNDPFDVPRRVKFSFDTAELQKAVVEEHLAVLEGKRDTSNPLLRNMAQGIARFDDDKRLAFFSELRESFEEIKPPSGAILDQFDVAWQDFVQSMRILCVSEIADSASMWAYYAGNHSGAVLTFGVIDELDSTLLQAQPVIYSDTPPSLPSKDVWARSIVGGHPVNWQEWFREYYYVKTTQWKEEREWRVITYKRRGEEGAYSDWTFHARELSAVMLGASIPPADAAHIQAILQSDYPHAELYQSTINYAERRLDFRPLHIRPAPE